MVDQDTTGKDACKAGVLSADGAKAREGLQVLFEANQEKINCNYCLLKKQNIYARISIIEYYSQTWFVLGHLTGSMRPTPYIGVGRFLFSMRQHDIPHF